MQNKNKILNSEKRKFLGKSERFKNVVKVWDHFSMQGCKWSANWRISANFGKTGQKLAEGKKIGGHDHQKLAEGLAQQAVVLAEKKMAEARELVQQTIVTLKNVVLIK